MVADLNMPKGLPTTLRIVDGAMLAYWAVALAACFEWIAPPAAAMYQGYGTPTIDSWNWSFAPLDLMFAVTGFLSLFLARRGDPRWVPLAIVSLALTFCAGLMAVSFWSFQSEFDPSWWVPNLALMGVAIWWMPRLINQSSRVQD